MKIRLTILTILLALIFTASLCPAEELVDRVAAVVGDEIILVSELDFQLQMFIMQTQAQNITQAQADSVRQIILEQLVSDKLILVEAQKDTGLVVQDEEVEQALAEKLEELRSRFQSESDFEAQMRLEGLTLRELKSKFRREVRNQLIKERFISRFLRKVNVTNAEVDEFYNTYKDSLPAQPDAVKLAHILLEVKPSSSTMDSAYAKAMRVKQLLDEGGDFVALAQLYSEDGTAQNGGDLGYFDKGTLFSEFEDVAFNLKPGEISEPFKTRLGYHIVKVEDKMPDRMRARHILFKTNPSSEDSRSAFALADSLRTLAVDSGVDFTELVKEYSIDDETKKEGGELGWFATEKLTPEFKAAIYGLDVGEISEPTESEFGIHLLKVLDRQEARPMTLKDDYDRIKDFARRNKSDQVLLDFLDEVRQKVYVDLRLK